MAWVRVDDTFPSHEKALAAGPHGVALWLEGMCYANRHLTDGRLLRHVVASFRLAAKPLRVAERLVAVGLWETDGEHFQIHDYAEHYPTAAEVKANREWDRRRKELYADGALVDAIKKRDQNRCRYCGVDVKWNDRRGPTGAQFDHVIPRGPNSYDNVVVACRSCNISKNNRTPEEAGLRLLPLGTRSEPGLNQTISSAPAKDWIGTGLDRSRRLEPSEDPRRSEAHDPATVVAAWCLGFEDVTGQPAMLAPGSADQHARRVADWLTRAQAWADLDALVRLFLDAPEFATKRHFGMFSANLAQLAAWLREHGPGVPYGDEDALFKSNRAKEMAALEAQAKPKPASSGPSHEDASRTLAKVAAMAARGRG